MRNSLKRKPFGVLAFALLTLLVALSWAAAPRAFAVVPYVTEQLTDNSSWEDFHQINASGQVVWMGWDGSDTEIYLYDPTDGVTQLTDNSYSDYSHPQINDAGKVVWRGWDGTDWEVYLYDPSDGATTQLTDNSYDESPLINASGKVVWYGNREILLATPVNLYFKEQNIPVDLPEPPRGKP